MTAQDWKAYEARANQAANRWAAVAEEHEAIARRDVWSKSAMTAINARNEEARIRKEANRAAEMAKRVTANDA